ncbi:MAG TPA: hypothetical protein DCX46_08025 [Bacteroidetes bacterium]|nr:hypothetical protein [Bacteroidota bacterium]
MSQAQDVLRSLLNDLPISELSSDEHRSTFEKIKERINSAADLKEELSSLYKVQDFSDFALGLMWIVDRAEKNPVMIGASEEDERLVFSSFRRAIGDAVASEETRGIPGGVTETPESAFASLFQGEEQTQEALSSFESASPEPTAAEESAAPSGTGDERSFSALVERFVEATQSGDDSRTTYLDQVVSVCDVVIAGDFPYDYKEFCMLLTEFLRYISENQLLDDVRVMNILSNVSSPVTQWANTSPDERTGLLEDAVAPLRDFKSLFE